MYHNDLNTSNRRRCVATNSKSDDNKFALLWGEAQMCLSLMSLM